ncbi:MAG: Rpn family recombination-promoting nuclease/putative transposase [Lachnospiraceae bacterium]|nr:Rpn family recombination-promoting nuclease/putative transposase [Lachnospiraceae bacterium]
MKQLKDLTLLDKFLFDETMDHPEAHEALLQIILGQEELRLMTPSQTEKEFRTMPWLRSIRVDVYALDQSGTVYDTEMQAEHRTDLAKRSRYYQGLIDSSLLEPGTISFNKLNNTYIIMITPYDLFGAGKYCYTFVPCCKEDKTIELQDGAIRIFLNTKGKNDHEVSQELRDFLHYVETTDEIIAENSESERLKKIHACVSRVKSSEEAGVKYMQKWEEKIIEREKALAEGRAETTLSSMHKLMEKMGMTAEEALDFLEIPKDEWETYLK